MSYQSPTQPHCRWCGKPIRKATTTVLFGRSGNERNYDSLLSRVECPGSVAEAQRLINGQVVSNTWWRPNEEYRSDEGKKPYINKVTTWDGESYADEFFDTGSCARYMGYAAAQAPHHMTTKAYREAVARLNPTVTEGTNR